MNAQIFVDSIKQVVVEGSINAVKGNLENPAGRNPAPRLVELTKWFKNLDIKNQRIVLNLVSESIETAVFRFLCVIDGVSTIENTEIKGQIKLFFEKENRSILLNNPNEDYLHDLL